MSGVLGRMSRPVAEAVSKKTGIPAATVTRAIQVLLPALLAVLSRRATKAGAAGGKGGLGTYWVAARRSRRGVRGG